MADCHRIIWVIILNIFHSYGRDIICSNVRDQNCFQKTINCISDGTDCTVTCSNSFACKDAVINCAAGVNCYVNCLKSQSCQNILINGGYATTLSVNSDAQLALIDGEINCQNVAYCDVICNDKQYQCRNLYIKAKQAGQLVVRCVGDNQYTYHCQGLNIYCPKTQHKCWIFSPIVLSQINIYSEFGFDGVVLCGNTNDKPIGNMHCGLEYQSSCTIHTFAVNYCDFPSVCDATNRTNPFTNCIPPPPSTSNPAENPTIITIFPTSIPTFIPSFNPNVIPTNSPTNNVTKTAAILAIKNNQVFDMAMLTTIISVLVLLCCLCMLCYYVKNKSNNVDVENENVNDNDNELQQLTVPDNGLILMLNATSEGNAQCIEEMSDNMYEGMSIQTGAMETVQTNKQSLSVSLGLNETVIETSSDEHLGVL
eukprot:479970_1